MSEDNFEPMSDWKNPYYRATAASRRMGEGLKAGSQLRTQIRSDLALGTFLIEVCTPSVIELLALAGFDFVVVDMEHSSIGFADLPAYVSASRTAGIPIVVRPWSQDTGLIGKILDAGVSGIMVPHVESADQARAIVAQARFAPEGDRGFSPLARYDALERPLSDFNDSTFVILQIEGKRGVENMREIAFVEGVDAIFVGPYDLSLSLGLEPGGPDVYAAAAKLGEDMPASVELGIYVDDPAKSSEWASNNYRLQCVSFDGRMLANGARQVVQLARKGNK